MYVNCEVVSCLVFVESMKENSMKWKRHLQLIFVSFVTTHALPEFIQYFFQVIINMTISDAIDLNIEYFRQCMQIN